MSGRVLVIAGPTASGKSGLAVALAQRFGGEVISADSMQIYRGMDIGTAKPTDAERGGMPHHMLDVAEPGEDYSVSRYAQQAAACCDEVLARGRLPIICGGTGLYIDGLLRSGGFRESGADNGLRQALEEEWARQPDALRAELRACDPESAARLHPNDRRRILRALEVYRRSGETISTHNARTRALPPRYDSVFLALDFRSRALLYARIDRRVERMMADGLLDEVRALRSRGALRGTAGQAIGYKELLAHLDEGLPLEQAVALVKQKSRNYAKRQLSWFRRDTRCHWLVREDEKDDALLHASTNFIQESGL